MRVIANVTAFAATVLAAALIGFGVPVAWLWIGSQLQAGRGATTVDFSVAMVVLFGIVREDFFDRDDYGPGPAAPRAPWMRGQTETRPGPRRQIVNGVERMFVVTTIVVTVAFWLWFIFESGSPLPNQ